MPTRLLDSSEFTITGMLTLASTGMIQMYEFTTMENVNDFVELTIALFGGIFLFYKIKMIRLDYKIKKNQHKKK